jgi:hypothetical protein
MPGYIVDSRIDGGVGLIVPFIDEMIIGNQ